MIGQCCDVFVVLLTKYMYTMYVHVHVHVSVVGHDWSVL